MVGGSLADLARPISRARQTSGSFFGGGPGLAPFFEQGAFPRTRGNPSFSTQEFLLRELLLLRELAVRTGFPHNAFRHNIFAQLRVLVALATLSLQLDALL